MASGKLGSTDLTADTYSTVYTVPAGKVATINVAVVNRGVSDAAIRVAIRSEAGDPQNQDFIEYDAIVPKRGGILERTAIVTGSAERVIAQASTNDVTIRIHGFEEEQ